MRKLSCLLKNSLLRTPKNLSFSLRFFAAADNNNHCCDDPSHNHNHNHFKPIVANTTEKFKGLDMISNFTDENFNEITVFPVVLNLCKQQWSPKNEENLVKLFSLIIRNSKKLKIAESVIMLIDKSRFLPKNFFKPGDKKTILNQAIEIYENHYFCKSDQGDRLKSIILVLSLSKYDFDHPFYEKILEKAYKEINDIDPHFLLSIVESFSFNKINVHSEITKKFNLESFSRIGQLSIKDLKIYPRILELFIYRVKTFPQLKEAETILNSVIIKLCNNILSFCLKDKNLKFHVLPMIEFSNFLTQYCDFIQPNTQIAFLNRQIKSNIDQYFQKNDLKKNFFLYPSVIEFMTTFFNNKASYIPPKLLVYLQTNMIHYNFEKMKDITAYIYFLSKHGDNFEVPLEINKKVLYLLENEKNLTNLVKLLDAYVSTKQLTDKSNENYVIQEQIFSSLEEKAMRFCKRLNYPPAPLSSLFQYLSFLGRGKPENWQFFFQHFTNKANLQEMDIFTLLVKLIPTAANKAKSEFKVITNVALNMTAVSSYLKNNREKAGLVTVMERFWSSLEDHMLPLLPKIYPDKYPALLVHLVYANLTYRKFTKIHDKLQEPILKHLKALTEKQIAGVLYSYSRVKSNDDLTSFFKEIGDNLKERIEKKPEVFQDYDLSNIYWAYSTARVYDQILMGKIEWMVMKGFRNFKLESITEFIRGLSNFNLKEIAEKSKILTSVIMEKLKDKNNKVELPHVFVWAHSFSVLDNKDVPFWKQILAYIIANKSLLKVDDFQHFYLYLLYLHLVCDEKLSKDLQGELDNVKKLLIQDKKAILNYLCLSKKKTVHESEENVIKIIKNYEKEQNINSKKEDVVEITKNGMKLLFFDDLNTLQKNNDYSNDFLEKFLIIPYATDYRRDKILFEYNGKIHYFLDVEKKKFVLNGATDIKKRFLENLGFVYGEIPFYIGDDEKKIVEYLKQNLKI